MPYRQVHVKLTATQLRKIADSYGRGDSARLRLGSHQLHHPDGHVLLLTEKEVARLGDGKIHTVTLSKSRIHKMHIGGFLPFLIPILAGLASAAGIAGGVATAVKSAKEAQLADAQKKLIAQAAVATKAGSGYGKRRRVGGCNGSPF